MTGDASKERTLGAATEYGRKVSVGKEISDKEVDDLDPNKKAGDAASGDSKTMIDLSPDAKKLLRLVPPDSGTSVDAANGTTPNSHGIMSEAWRRFGF